MTLENCQRLLKHYNDLADGTIQPPLGHRDWNDVMANAKVRAAAMQERVTHKLEGKSKLTKQLYGNLKPVEVKKDGKKSA